MTDEAATILVVEDDDATRTFLADNLTADGHEVLVADCARDALRLLETKFPDLVLLEVVLPDASGLDLLRRVRDADGLASRVNPATPVIVLSGRDSELDRVRSFEMGADDHVGKPFSYGELRLRIAALLRRLDGGRRPGARVRVGDLEVDGPSRSVLLRGRRIELSQKEFALLRMLASDATRVWTKEELLRSVWGYRTMSKKRRKRNPDFDCPSLRLVLLRARPPSAANGRTTGVLGPPASMRRALVDGLWRAMVFRVWRSWPRRSGPMNTPSAAT